MQLGGGGARMLSFTRSGLVATPRALQVRIGPSGTAPRANAPAPARAMSSEEVVENLHYFTEGRRGPRTQPVTSLALSGASAADPVADAVLAARKLGVSRVTVHADPELVADLAALTPAAAPDAVAVGVRGAVPGAVGLREWTAILELDDAGCAALAQRAAALVAGPPPTRVVFTWPFPPHGSPAAPEVAVGAIREALPTLRAAGIPVGVKGLAACHLVGVDVDVWRSANRFYVDAEHQRERALLFFPDVIRFARQDACRFCRLESVCEGVPAAWLARGLAGTLRPMDRT